MSESQYSEKLQIMDETQDNNSGSWESCNSFGSECNVSSKQDYTCYFLKITEELQFHFKRNIGQEDYCDDIYEDIYTTPQSGSGNYSYYRDLLMMSQNKNSYGEGTLKAVESPKVEERKTIISESNYPWTFSGYGNPSVGLGPLQELFKVLDPPRYEPYVQPTSSYSLPAIVEPNFQEMPRMTNIPSVEINNVIEDGYSDFVDIFRWTADTFPIEFLPINPNDF